MKEERKKLGFEKLLNVLLSNFGRMLLVNLVFAVPLFAALTVAYLIYLYLLPMSTLVLPLALIFASPFYPGVVVLNRNYSQGDYSNKLFNGFLRAIKENILKSLIGGVLMYIAFVGCYYSITFYSALTSVNWVFSITLFVSILICLFLLFFFYGFFLISVSFELKIKDVIKNSALMTFGEIKQNFLATFALIVYLAVVLTPVIVIYNLAGTFSIFTIQLLLFIYLALVVGLLIPSQCSLIISHFLYTDLRAVIAGEVAAEDDEEASEISVMYKSGTAYKENLQKEKERIADLLEGDDDEYIFYNGKMMKRKVLRDSFGNGDDNNEN